MPLQAQQLCALCAQEARGPGYLVQAGEYLNLIQGDLCQIYDFEVAAKTLYGTFNPGLIAKVGNSLFGSGPYPLPSDFLRFKNAKSSIWTLLGVPYVMICCDLDEFDALVQQSGIQSYPYIIATDMSVSDVVAQQLPAGSAGAFYVYSPPSGAYPYQVRYQAQIADIASPQTSAVVPWFPNQGYLRKKLSAYLMGLTGDDREEQWHKDADDLLDRYLLLKDNKNNRAATVTLDRRRFGRSFSTLPNTKTVGW